MSFDKIVDLTAGVYFYFYNIYCRSSIFAYFRSTIAYRSSTASHCRCYLHDVVDVLYRAEALRPQLQPRGYL